MVENAKAEHYSEVRRLALVAISEIMPSLARFAHRQDLENSNKYSKMLELFSKSQSYPARLIPSPSVALDFANKRKESAKKVYDVYKSVGGIPLDQPSDDSALLLLQDEMKKFIEQERMLQSLDELAIPAEEPGMAKADVSDNKAEADAEAQKMEQAGGKSIENTFKVFEAFEELADDISQELSEQETSVLLQKSLANGQKRLANFWRNRQLVFDCEVVDLSKSYEGYTLKFSLVGDSDRLALLPLINTTEKINLKTIDLKIEDVKPGKKFKLIVSVSSSLDRNRNGGSLQTLGGLQVSAPNEDILFFLNIQRAAVVWEK